MNAVSLIILVATISGVDGGTAQIEAGLAHGLRPGDTGQIFYQLTVGSEARRVDVGEATVTAVDELTATCTVPAGKTRPGLQVEFELPADRAGPENMLDLVGSRLSEMQATELEEPLRSWIDRLIPQGARLEEKVVRILRERRPAQLGEGRAATPSAPAPRSRIEPRRRDQVSIPGRVYLVGVDLREAEFYSQQPQFAIELEPFLLDARPVTRTEFLVADEGFVFPDSAGREATGVTWAEADAYCRDKGLRLPTEFEWEIAIKTAGMESEVLEWTASWYEPYPGNRVAEPEYGQRFRVVRGAPSEATFDVHRRRFVAPDSRHRKLGFRCATNPEPPN